MTELWPAYAAAVALGAVHALEVDHMVAVSAFIGTRPRFRVALAFGMRWGVGHALAVFVLGGTLAWTGVRLPEPTTTWTELGVGVMLVGLGLWAGATGRRLHVHDPARHGGHAHLHAHPPEEHPHGHHHADRDKRHRHLSTLVGAVHGLAGTAPVMALIPVTLIRGPWAATGYLAAFGVGTILAMGLYAALAAAAIRRASTSVRLARRVAAVTAVASIAVGGWWIVRAALQLLE